MPRPSLVFALVVMVAAEGSWALTESQQTEIVKKHNEFRSGVSPEASDMMRMKWDKTLEDMATAYAQKCIWGHNTDRGNKGENLYYTTSATLDVDQAIGDWQKEVQFYDFNANTCVTKEMCGHYTQVVWASSDKVGCGEHLCAKLEGDPATNAILLVCNYDPSGNIDGSKPYTQGTACSKCSEPKTCTDKLCESGGSSSGGDGSGGGGSSSSGQQPGQNTAIALLTAFIFIWFCLN